jgi:PAS domain S-box-containing protein
MPASSSAQLPAPGGSRERFFRLLAEAIPEIVFTAGRDGRSDYVNGRWAEFTGLPRERAHGYGWLDVLHPEDLAACRERWSRAVEGGDAFEVEYRFRRHDGSYRWFLGRSEPLLDDDGRVLKWFGTCTDIDDRRRAEQGREARARAELGRRDEALEESRRLFRTLAGVVPAVVYLYDAATGRPAFTNREQKGLLGYTPEQFRDFGPEFLARVMHPEDLARFPEHVAALVAAPDGAERAIAYRMRHADGTWRWFHGSDTVFSRRPDGSVHLLLGAALDVTAWREAEDRSRRLEERSRAMFEQAGVGIAMVGPDGRFQMVNAGFRRLVGFDEAELRGMTVRDLTHPDDIEPDLEQARRVLAREIDTYTVEKRYRTRAGGEVWVSLTCSAVRRPDGEVDYALGIAHDITERKRAEAERERLYREAEAARAVLDAIMEHAPEGLTIADAPDVRIRMVSRYGQRLVGRPPGDLTAIPAGEHPGRYGVYHADGRTPARPEELPLTRATVAGEVVADEEWVIARPDGARVPVLCNAGPIRDRDGRITGGIIAWRDIAERKQAEEALRLSARRFRAAIDAVSGIVWTTDAEGAMRGEQPGWAALTGQDRADYQGLGWAGALHPEDAGSTLAAWREAVAGRRTFVLEHRVRRADGRWGRFAVRALPVLREDGTVAEWVGVHTDVTEQRALEAAVRDSEQRLRQALSAGRVMSFEWTVATDVALRSESAGDILGTGPDAACDTGARFFAMVHPEDRPRFREVLDRLATAPDRRYSLEYRLVRPDGRTIWLQENAQGAFGADGRLERVSGMVLDVTERKLAEERLGEFARSNVVGIVYGDAAGGLSFANEEFARIVGRPRAEIVAGRLRWDAITPPGWLAADALALDEARRSGACSPYEKEYLRPDGTRVPVLVGLALAGPDREQAVAFVLDLSRQKGAERELRRNEAIYRRLAEANLFGVGFGTSRGEVSYVNDEMLRMMGRTRADFEAGRVDWMEAIAPEFRERIVREARRVLEEGRASGYEAEFLRPDGGRTPYTGAAAQVTPGEDFHVSIALDLTEVRAAERALREADVRKDEFLAMLAHELRNPLAAVSNAAAVLDARGDAEGEAWAREVIARQARQLARLVDDLMDISRIARGKLQLKAERLDATGPLRRASQALEGVMAAKRHAFRADLPEGPVWVDADPTRLEQMVVNLLHNAAKYTDPGGHVALEARIEGGTLAVDVTDDGVGLAPEMLARIFEPFAQVDTSLHRSQGGLGIGLTLVRTLAGLHGGTVEAASAGPGRGSRFTLRLPTASPPAVDPAAPAPGRREPARGLRVLAVDDNADTLAGLARILSRCGHEVRTATDGPAGLALAREFGPDVALLDIGLPGLDGYELAAALRADPARAAATLIALSGYGQPSDRARSREAGFDHHLVKPVQLPQLLALLDGVRRGEVRP